MTSAPNHAAPISVLIVDDDPWVTRALDLALSSTGFRVSGIAHQSVEAVTAYAANPADVVLMDINMPPGPNGIEAIAAIMRRDPRARILALTTIAPGPGLARALEAGALAALQKTASEHTLAGAIRLAAGDEDPVLLRGLLSDMLASGGLPPYIGPSPPQLSPSETEILLRICEGKSYEDIAEQLHISSWTAKAHAKQLRQKLDAGNLAQLVLRAVQLSYI